MARLAAWKQETEETINNMEAMILKMTEDKKKLQQHVQVSFFYVCNSIKINRVQTLSLQFFFCEVAILFSRKYL
jgi:hypothetical protein